MLAKKVKKESAVMAMLVQRVEGINNYSYTCQESQKVQAVRATLADYTCREVE